MFNKQLNSKLKASVNDLVGVGLTNILYILVT